MKGNKIKMNKFFSKGRKVILERKGLIYTNETIPQQDILSGFVAFDVEENESVWFDIDGMRHMVTGPALGLYAGGRPGINLFCTKDAEYNVRVVNEADPQSLEDFYKYLYLGD